MAAPSGVKPACAVNEPEEDNEAPHIPPEPCGEANASATVTRLSKLGMP